MERLLSPDIQQLFDLVINHQYIPQSSSREVGIVLDALRENDKDFKVDMGCGSCVMEAIKQGYRLAESLKPKIVEVTMPKHKKK